MGGAESIARLAEEPGPEALKHACLGFHRDFPNRSARHVFTVLQGGAIAFLVAGVVEIWRAEPALAFAIAHALGYTLFLCAIGFRLMAAALLERPAPALYASEVGHWPTYTILCPLRGEANVLHDLMAALNQLDYPKHVLDVVLLVEKDDDATLAAARDVAREPHMRVVVIPAAAPRTKPKALNVGLETARGEFIVVYDAEDRPHPLQLRAALAAFAEGGEELACVQAPLAIDNADASWIAAQFALEYAIQFREILPLLARWNLPLPLGGSSNHFRTRALKAAGGWDAWNVTEDADLGYRLARDGRRAATIAPPTWEEAPVTYDAWLSQRTRWIKGHMQTWLVLMRNPFRTAREMGWRGFAAMQLILGGGIAASFMHGPLFVMVLAAALSAYNLTPPDFVLALTGYCVAMLAALTATALSGDLAHMRAAPMMPFYWPLATLAAVRAVFELVFQPHRWSKTAHGVSTRPALRFSGRGELIAPAPSSRAA